MHAGPEQRIKLVCFSSVDCCALQDSFDLNDQYLKHRFHTRHYLIMNQAMTMSPIGSPPPAYHDHDFSKTTRSLNKRARKVSPSHASSIGQSKRLDNDQIPSTPPPPFRRALDFPSSTQSNKIIAVPQETPSRHSAFVQAWTPVLLSYGIPRQSFTSFLSTVSGILSATTSDAVVAHAGRLARSTVVDIPASFGKDVTGHACASAKHFGHAVKSGNPFAMVGATLGGTVGLTLGVTGRLIGTVFSVPGALLQKPQSARQRAEAFLETANRKWFSSRGLCAKIMTADEIASLLGIDAERLMPHAEGVKAVEALMGGLGEYMEPVEFEDVRMSQSRTRGTDMPTLRITRRTLWVVILQGEAVRGTESK